MTSEEAEDAFIEHQTVGNLIACLQKLPADAPVRIADRPNAQLVIVSPPYLGDADGHVWIDVEPNDPYGLR